MLVPSPPPFYLLFFQLYLFFIILYLNMKQTFCILVIKCQSNCYKGPRAEKNSVHTHLSFEDIIQTGLELSVKCLRNLSPLFEPSLNIFEENTNRNENIEAR